MGGFTGKYSRSPFSVFDEEKNYALALLQEGVPVTDDDWNDHAIELFTRIRRGNQLFGNYGTPNDGFRVQEATNPANNFRITGGGPANSDIESAGRFFMRGISCLLLQDADYMSPMSTLSEKSIHPRITRIYYDGSQTVIEDSAANWITNELKSATSGRQIVVNGTTYNIDSNGADFVKLLPLGIDYTNVIQAGNHYVLTLTTPLSAPRTDAIYLNVYIDEYDAGDDPAINKTVGGVEIEAMRRAKIINTIFVRESMATELTDYVDSDGSQHFVFKLATLTRTTSSDILTAMITDHVPSIGFESISQAELTLLRPSVTSPESNQIYVEPGQSLNSNGDVIVTWAGGLSPAWSTPVTVGNTRWDALVLRDDGTLDIVQGVESVGTPVKPFVYGIPIAFVLITETGAITISESDVVDARSLFTPGPNWKILSPEGGNLVSQFSAHGVKDGDRFWLLPGTYSLGGSTLSIVANSVTIAGSSLASIVMSSVSEQIQISGDDVNLIGFSASDSVQNSGDGSIISISGDRPVLDHLTVNWTGASDHIAAIAISISGNDARCSNLLVNTGTYKCIGIRLASGGVRSRITDCIVYGHNPAIYVLQSYSSVSGCHVNGNLLGIQIATADYVRVSDCYCYGNQGYPVEILNGADDCLLSDLYLESPATTRLLLVMSGIRGSAVNVMGEGRASLSGDSNSLISCNFNLSLNSSPSAPTVLLGGSGHHRIIGCRLRRDEAIPPLTAPLIMASAIAGPDRVVIADNDFIITGDGPAVLGNSNCSEWVVKNNTGVRTGISNGGWKPSTVYATGDLVSPNFFTVAMLGTLLTTRGGVMMELTSAGGTSGASEPGWVDLVGSVVSDGALQWTVRPLKWGVCPNLGVGWEIDHGAAPISGWSNNVTYTATCDCIVQVHANGNDTISIHGYADQKSGTADTLRVSDGNRYPNSLDAGMTMFVRRGENWRVWVIPSGSLYALITVIPWE